MTRVRFLTALLAAGLVVLAGGVSAAPVPKDADRPGPPPDLQTVFDIAEKAVEARKWPAQPEEERLVLTAWAVFDRTARAAGQKDRKLPVDFEKLKKLDVVKDYEDGEVDGVFLIARDVRLTGATNCVIFATNKIQITGAKNCVIFAQHVRCTDVENCLVVGGYLRSTSARSDSVLVATDWIRATGANGVVCHLVHPGVFGPPDETVPPVPAPAIRMTTANGVTFLNAAGQWKATSDKNCATIELKTPIAK